MALFVVMETCATLFRWMKLHIKSHITQRVNQDSSQSLHILAYFIKQSPPPNPNLLVTEYKVFHTKIAQSRSVSSKCVLTQRAFAYTQIDRQY